MSQDLEVAYSLIKDQGEQILDMMRMLEANLAICEAHKTILQSIVPFVKSNPDFDRVLKNVHNVRLSAHLEKDVSNEFIMSYNRAVDTLLYAKPSSDH